MDRIGNAVSTKAKKSFARSGGHAGAAFAAGFLKTITLGQLGSGFAMASMKLKPSMAHAGGVLGVALAAGLATKLASSVSALLTIGLGGAMLAGPIAYIIKGQLKALDEMDKAYARSEQLREQIDNTSDKKKKARLQDDLKQQEAHIAALKRQTEALRKLQGSATTFMETISKPVRMPLERTINAISNRLDEWGPKFSAAIKPLAKALEPFVQGALDGIESFTREIGNSLPGIVAGFQQWGKELPGIGEALGSMLSSWIGSADEAEQSVRELSGSMQSLALGIGEVGKGFRRFNQVSDDFGAFVQGQKAMVLQWRIAMLESLSTVMTNWANSPFAPKFAKKWAAGISESLETARREFKKTTDQINRAKIVAKLKADKKDAEGKIKDINAQLKKTHNQKTISKLKADKAAAEAAIRRVTGLLNQLHGKTAVTWIKTMRMTYYGSKGKPPTNPKGDAHGGNIGGAHAAEGGMHGGQVLVGEQGPEIVDLPFGSHVNSNPDSQRMMANSGGRGNISITINAPNVTDTNGLRRMLVDMHRRGELDVVLR